MAFDFTYPTPLPSTKGWGPGWPNCVSSKMRTHPVFKPSVNEKIWELVNLLVWAMEQKGFHFMDPGCWGYFCKDGGSGTPSFHSWGLALDINAPRNVWGADEQSSEIATKERWVVNFLREYGFFWLGPPIKDWMHFSFCGSVEDAERMTERARREIGSEMSFLEFDEGLVAHKNGEAFKDSWPTHKKRGWNLREDAVNRPAPGDHDHSLPDHEHEFSGVTGP